MSTHLSIRISVLHIYVQVGSYAYRIFAYVSKHVSMQSLHMSIHTASCAKAARLSALPARMMVFCGELSTGPFHQPL